MLLPVLGSLGLALAAGAPVPPRGEDPPLAVVLPEGPAARAWAQVSGRHAPGGPCAIEPWPAWPEPPPGERDPWATGPPWRRWVELVRAEAPLGPQEGERSDEHRAGGAARRAALALLARAQGRDADAWAHWTRLAEDGELAAALLPAFLPGVPPGTDLGALAPGVLLAPALPPPRPPDADPIGPWTMQCGPLRIGATLVELRVALAEDGVEVTLVHLEGPATSVRLAPPLPPGAELTAVYVDWVRRPDPTGPHEVLVGPEEPEHALWARFRRAREPWPASLPPPGLGFPRRAGLAVVVDPGLGRVAERALGLGEALAELYRVPCAFLEPADGPAALLGAEAAAGEPLVLRFAGARAAEKLTALVSLAERHALAHGP